MSPFFQGQICAPAVWSECEVALPAVAGTVRHTPQQGHSRLLRNWGPRGHNDSELHTARPEEQEPGNDVNSFWHLQHRYELQIDPGSEILFTGLVMYARRVFGARTFRLKSHQTEIKAVSLRPISRPILKPRGLMV